ncbi:DUF3800 domain-containing protein [Lentisalinibacter salinarum]|uniref:DUF3800 domain-containing protein n=1 Tax=Lentisalinibacter salinarum TaxID=2992239 RepID=UPI00386FCE0C
MKLIFFDESKDQPDYPYYHIGGVCIDESELATIEQEINRVAKKAFGSSELTRSTELHAVDIYQRKRNFKNCPDFGKRLELLNDLARILSTEAARLIDVQINCGQLWDSQCADDIAFMFFCERANDLVAASRDLGMLLGDRENDQVAEKYARFLSGYRAQGTDFRFGRDIENLVDSVHFTHSHLSRFLQLADVYTWFLQFLNRNTESEHPRHKSVIDVLRGDDVNLFPSKYKSWPREQ